MKSEAATDPASPDLATLNAANAAFVRGDFAEVRALTSGLDASLDHEIRKKARALRTRVSVDPIAIVVILVSVAFFIAVAAKYLGHGS
jgi:hypothetical protein